MFRYIPRAGGSYYDVSTGEPVTVAEHGPHCDHPKRTWFSFEDRRSDDLDVWQGICCTVCGFITDGPKKRS